jgi:hypothetical protein
MISTAMKPFLGCHGTLNVGNPVVFETDAPGDEYGVVFEDDGRTGYFYARDYSFPEIPFVDALHIYSVKGVVDADKPSTLRIVWSPDWTKAALLMNDMPHAMFDFEEKVGYSIDVFPEPDPKTGWTREPSDPEFKSFFYRDE